MDIIAAVSTTEPRELWYRAPRDSEDEGLAATLEARLRVLVEPALRREVTYFDTFDWRIHRVGGRLCLAPGRGGSALTWLNADGTVRHRLLGDKAPAFAWDFPDGHFRREIETVIAMRRLLPIVELSLAGRVLRVLDDLDKTVVRLQLEHGTVTDVGAAREGGKAAVVALPETLRVRPVRGFDKDFRQVVKALEGDLGLERLATSELERALEAIRRQAGDYASKVAIELDPAMPAAEAAKAIHRTLLATIRRNEHGTRRDLDSEFLHDLRVAVRRTRSALSQIKGVYPADVLARFKVEFKWLGGLTGPVRDLDVYLLKIPSYRAELPAPVADDLVPLAEYLRDRQRREQRSLSRKLGSKRYLELLASWGEFLDQPADLEAAANAGRPIGEVASERIWKVYRRVLKRGLAIDAYTPAEAVHDLRIECKKLRYLMEFFRGLYDPDRIGLLIKELKKLQDNLGDFNDYEVQQGSLKEFAEEMAGQAAPAATLMAMGRLVEHLEGGQARERQAFAERFTRFARDRNQRLARDLFAGG